MEAVAAFGLACGIIQIIDFSTKAVKMCREIYKNGALSENREAEEMAKRLRDVCSSLDLNDNDCNDDLHDLGQKCASIAERLIAELGKLKLDAPHKKRQMVKKIDITGKRKKTIRDIEKQLEQYTRLLERKILVDLRKQTKLLAVQQSKSFDTLDLKVQNLIKSLTEGVPNFHELKVLIQVESRSIKGLFERQQNVQAQERYYQQFLESLYYPGMSERQEAIGIAHEETFQWIFEPVGDRRWDNFSQWLGQGEGIYWLSGKAGSGKSTLMSYIYHDDRTTNYLKIWAGAKEVITPRFFFWSAGDSLQKSSEGLLRSLLYQILQKYPSLTPLDHDCFLPNQTQNSQQHSRAIEPWTKQRLREVFQTVFVRAQENSRICIFLDGLDETSEDAGLAVETVQNLLSPNTKVCLSSRQDRPYTDAFESSAKLRLQDLTWYDIENYVWDRLNPLLLEESRAQVSEIVDSLVQKAQGVFLWVSLVVKTLIRGLSNQDSLEQLQTRVDSMPSDIEALYVKMLSNIDVPHHKEAALLFQLALESFNKSLLNITLALCNEIDNVSDLTIDSALSYTFRAQRRIPTVCAGLLEVHLEDKEDPGSCSYGFNSLLTMSNHDHDVTPTQMAEIHYFESHTKVSLIHRTASDFFHHHKEGRIFLEKNRIPNRDPYSTCVRILLTKLTLLGLPDTLAIKESHPGFKDQRTDEVERNCRRDYIRRIMERVRLAEWHATTAQLSLCDDVDRTLTAVSQRYQSTPKSSQLSSAIWSVKPMESGPFLPAVSWSRHTLQSRSPVLFRSARTESIPPTDTVDFLGFAAIWGLSRYVLDVVNLQEQHFDRRNMDYLLCQSIYMLPSFRFRKPCKESISGTLHLIGNILSRGGNPNLYVEDYMTTVWGYFLNSHHPEDVISHPEDFSEALKAFLNSGADIHVKCPETVAFWVDKPEPPASPTYFSSILCFRRERSALHVIRNWKPFAPGLKEVEESVVTAGGLDVHKYSHFAFQKDHYRPFKLSGKQSDEISSAFDRRYQHDPHLSSKGREERWEKRLWNIRNKLWESTRYSDWELPSEAEQGAPYRGWHVDPEERFYDAVSVQSTADENDD